KSAQIREILISESAWEEMTCLFAPSIVKGASWYLSNLQKLVERVVLPQFVDNPDSVSYRTKAFSFFR
ncbi:hypothetical protein F1D63_26415, partial [Klebsiella pneumoniae]